MQLNSVSAEVELSPAALWFWALLQPMGRRTQAPGSRSIKHTKSPVCYTLSHAIFLPRTLLTLFSSWLILILGNTPSQHLPEHNDFFHLVHPPDNDELFRDNSCIFLYMVPQHLTHMRENNLSTEQMEWWVPLKHKGNWLAHELTALLAPFGPQAEFQNVLKHLLQDNLFWRHIKWDTVLQTQPS